MTDLLESVAALEEAKTLRGFEDQVLPTVRAGDLIAATPEEPDWLVPGLLARGWALMVSAREKTGKGTFVAYLIGALEAGAPTVFGSPASSTLTSLVFTEEPEDAIAEKGRDLSLNDSHYLFAWDLPPEIRRITDKRKRWEATVQALTNTAVAGGHELLFIDNISRAANVEEEGGVELSRAVEVAAEYAKRASLTIIIDHHHRKSGGDMRDRSRGGTGVGGAVDVSLSMDRGKNAADRKRDLVCIGRRKATIWEKTIELDEDGQDYTLISDTGYSEREEHASSGHHRLESKRLDLLRELNLARNDELGQPWVTAEDAAAAWGLTATSAKRYLLDRLPNQLVVEGPQVDNRRTFAAPGWETAAAAEPATITNRPTF